MELSVILGIPVVITGILSFLYAILVISNRRKYEDGSLFTKDWNFHLKRLWALRAVQNWKKRRHEDVKLMWNTEVPHRLHDNTCDNIIFYGTNKDNYSLYISVTRRACRISNVILILTIENGTQYQLPNHPCTSYTSASNESWNAAGLNIQIIEAFQRWRVTFNGLLSTINQNGKEETKHVRFNFIWIFAAAPTRIPTDSSDSLLAEAVAIKPWKDPYWLNEVTHYQKRGYDQYGCMIGFIILDEAEEPRNINFQGMRKRRWQPVIPSLHKHVSLFGVASDGTSYIIEVELLKGLTLLKHGNVRLPSGAVSPIEAIDMDFGLIFQASSPPKSFTIRLTTKTKYFSVFITLNNNASLKYKGSNPEPWRNHMIPYQMGVNGYQGSGYMELWYPSGENPSIESSVLGRHLTWLPRESIDGQIPICVTFKEKIASCPAIVGGKAASLALLSSVVSHEYEVPNGFSLTSRALEVQLSHHQELMDAIKDIERAGADYDESTMKKCCQRASELFEKTPLCDIVACIVKENYMTLFESENKKHNEITYVAVRSSGIGEDSEELSAAGQNASFLGCKQLTDVYSGVQKCWASLFTFQSVEYRRQYGQVVNCGMGVVVQAMVESEAAGVMFTRHPNNGNPKEVLITSSYGLGESVVSGHVEPDTIIVDIDRDKLKIKSYEIGNKKQQILIDHTGDQQTLTVDLKEDEGKKISISHEQCLALAKLGLEQEAMWGSPRDIEWAIVKGKIYLLQARPITCLNNWTEFELLHEQDSAIMSEDDIMTFANTGEVLPGAISLLSQSLVSKNLDKSIEERVNKKQKANFTPLFVLVNTHHHFGINVMNTFLRHPEKKISVTARTMDIGVCGHPVVNDKMMSIALHRYGYGRLRKLQTIIDAISDLWRNKKACEDCQEISRKLKIDLSGCSSSQEILNRINSQMPDLLSASMHHTAASSSSAFSQAVFLTTIIGSDTDFTTEHYQDIGTILSSCTDVVSAEIPEMLKNISLILKESGKGEIFSKQNPEEALEWLKINVPSAHSMLTNFLAKHGHRCVKEFDVAVNPWGLDPNPLIKTLQLSYNIPGKESPESVPTDELISKLHTPITNSTKKVLKFVIPMCQKSVTRRESTKSALVSIIHQIRLALHQLGKQMVKEWRLPDKKLMFMLTYDELTRLIQTRDPGLVAKAKLRMRYFEKWNEIQFNELNWGFPQPLVKDKLKVEWNGAGDVVIRGTPVCSGDIVARACVVSHISMIDTLQYGDILITQSTDIGWSPYFPMLGGVVTELGGLISHGAVIAREYGLPCIVGAEGATSVFKTGDTVLLSAGSGLLKRVENSENTLQS